MVVGLRELELTTVISLAFLYLLRLLRSFIVRQNGATVLQEMSSSWTWLEVRVRVRDCSNFRLRLLASGCRSLYTATPGAGGGPRSPQTTSTEIVACTSENLAIIITYETTHIFYEYYWTLGILSSSRPQPSSTTASDLVRRETNPATHEQTATSRIKDYQWMPSTTAPYCLQ